jgi:hypothetical protein
MLPISVHRAILSAIKGKTNIKTPRPGQEQEILTPTSFNESLIWNETGNRVNAI